jgi:hypothetical protein
MLTSLSKIAEEVLLRLGKDDDDNNIDEREIILSLHKSLATFLLTRYYGDKQTESYDDDGSLYYPIHGNEVKKNSVTDMYYITVPSTTVSLPFGTDISRVGTPKGRGYIEVPMGFNDLYVNFDSSNLEENIGYYREATRLYFVNMTEANNPCNVSVTMVLPIDKLDEEDMINIPGDMQDVIIETVYLKYSKSAGVPTDELNNSNDE